MNITAYTHQTVEPEAVLSLAQLLLQWPYETAENINAELYTCREKYGVRANLTLFELKKLYYQKQPAGTECCTGFLLEMEAIAPPGSFRYCDYIRKFSEIYVLKEDVFEIEKAKRHYCGTPAGNMTKENEYICSPKNLHILGPKILQKIFSSDGFVTSPYKPEDEVVFTEKHVWPWLGSFIDNIPRRRAGRTTSKGEEEGAALVRTARLLGQNDLECLAKMLAHHYPKISFPKLHEIIHSGIKKCAGDPTKEVQRLLFGE